MTSITGIILAISLFIIMAGMGLSLAIADFKRIVKYPKAVIVGLSSQLILLPVIAFLICYFLALPPVIAIGIMLIASCPGGATSNMISYLAKGDLALSVSLTAIASLLSFITIPFIMNIGFHYFLEESQAMSLDFMSTLKQLFVIIIIPVLIGMFINKKFPEFAFRVEKPVKKASMVLFILVVVGVTYSNRNEFIEYFGEAGLPSILLNIFTMLAGYLLAIIFKLPKNQAVTISIESGIQNGTLAITIATLILQKPEYTIVPLTYGLLMFFTAAVIIAFRKRAKESDLIT
ncbi:bile acid:sodium symporter family protein [Lutimonas halocynthiae]|uniref:bile acid:sodium symporter family protein n=1 Tax=Lutimonas halocynthiae TaxID=1446477 RepID=UPI0025B399FA|nr:bile acid:sodium symporter family protein [Lutimonas halocynthiae]MDN3642137.1 bile acid:sodium symporter family protein [Lutimonas halocynthiae]